MITFSRVCKSALSTSTEDSDAGGFVFSAAGGTESVTGVSFTVETLVVAPAGRMFTLTREEVLRQSNDIGVKIVEIPRRKTYRDRFGGGRIAPPGIAKPRFAEGADGDFPAARGEPVTGISFSALLGAAEEASSSGRDSLVPCFPTKSLLLP